jgi:hypothetical protein
MRRAHATGMDGSTPVKATSPGAAAVKTSTTASEPTTTSSSPARERVLRDKAGRNQNDRRKNR